MATTPVPAPKQSWLSKVGSFLGKILGVVATEAAPIEKIAEPVALALLPQFAPLINEADGIFSKIVSEAVVAESAKAAVGQATGSGAEKLAAVLTNIGPVIDGWVNSNFPGAATVSTVAKSGLVNAVVAILNEIEPSAVAAGLSAPAAPPPPPPPPLH
jgi:hypothetical protein